MRVMCLTGAGISVSSGLHTYRGSEGRYTSIKDEFGLPVEKLLSPPTLMNNPELLWAYWRGFLANLQGVKPSISHQALRKLAQSCDAFLEVTQNVDGLSRAAGIPEDSLIELHGRADTFVCMKCKVTRSSLPSFDRVPYCPDCRGQGKGILRPNVTLFCENLSRKSVLKAHAFLESAEVFVVAGTSIQFEYLVYMITEAIRLSIPVVYVDPKASPYAGALLTADFDTDLVNGIIPIRLAAEIALPLLVDELIRLNQVRNDPAQFKAGLLAFKEATEAEHCSPGEQVTV